MQVYWPPRNRRFGAFDAFGLIGLGGLLVARFIPVAKLIPFWGCFFRMATGWPCPGCGLTRAADRFAHFHWLGALKANPLGTVAAALFAVAAGWTFLHLVFAVPTPDVTFNDREWKRIRNSLGAGLLLNYLFVIAQTRQWFA